MILNDEIHHEDIRFELLLLYYEEEDKYLIYSYYGNNE